MTEKQPRPELPKLTTQIATDSKTCGLEGIGGQPDDCKNNPWKYPNNYRPELCRQCPLNSLINEVAEKAIPSEYIRFKQKR